MVTTPVAPISFDLPEKRVVLYDLSWQAYETILAALGDRRSAQLTYYKGMLEIMTPLESHENSKHVIGNFIEILVDEGDFEGIKGMGSTTLNFPTLHSGAEPDQAYYIANESLVRGKTVDLKTDPPPDLILEVDITHTDIDKNALYAEMGVPEFWRYNGRTLTIYALEADSYQEVEVSPTFPGVPKERLYEYLRDCAEVGEKQAKWNLRNWLQQQKS
ncbi:Uma2 family endonuclease [Pseudanabaena sp. PCC 6802]|uniref:Uma2 family endonuclease n=1 Tax=Pseudanabaena sp. PCC 6802 TaxID=118173 RepID=UPI00034BCC03|nr:Uma2 family endonuclease [Pseudanabaena sp. PCC 6802]